jgi:2-oxoglutarate ferredoxin oxidoreductase subunit gamma
MMQTILKILLAGEGGQGIQSIAEILAEAANSEGKEALYIPNFGVEQRGGISMAYLQVTEKGQRIGAPKFEKADILIALSSRAIARTRHHAGEDTIYIYDNSLIEPTQVNDQIIGLQYFESTPPCPTNQKELKIGEEDVGDNRGCTYYHEAEVREKKIPRNVKNVISIPANDIAKNELNPRVFNIMILGAVIAATQILPIGSIEKALEEKLGEKFKKDPKLRDLNKKALTRGYELLESLLKGEKNG